MEEKSRLFIKILLLCIIAFYAISLLHPAYWNWGTFAVFGKPVSLAILALALVLLFVTPASRFLYGILQRALEGISETLGRLPKMIRAILWVIIPALLLYLLKTNSHILGVGDVFLRNVANGTAASPSIYGFGLLLNKLNSLFSISDINQAAMLLSAISIISGVIFLYFSYKIIDLLMEDSPNKNLIFLLIASSSTIILFAGYIESYPILIAWLAVYLYYSLLYLRGRGRAGRLVLVFIAGLFWHLWFIAFLPSLIYLFNERLKIIPGKIMAALTGLYLIGIYVGGQIVLRDGRFISLPILPGSETDYTLFSGFHLIDFGNELIIIGPALALLSLLLIFFIRKTTADSNGIFLLYAAIPALIMFFIIDPIIGGIRDWDLLSIFGLPLMIMGMTVFAGFLKKKSSLAFLLPGILLLNVFHTSGFITNNKDPKIAVDRVVRVLLDDPHYQQGYYGAIRNSTFAVILANEYQRYPDAISFLKRRVDAKTTTINDIYLLANYNYFAGQYKAAAMIFDLIRDKINFSPEERFGYGYSLYTIGEYPRAVEQFRLALGDKCISEAGLYAAASFAHDYQLDSCKKYCDISIQCSNDRLRAMHNIVLFLPGWVFPRLKAQYETKVLAAYPDSMEIRSSLVHLFQQAGMPDSAEFYMNYRK